MKAPDHHSHPRNKYSAWDKKFLDLMVPLICTVLIKRTGDYSDKPSLGQHELGHNRDVFVLWFQMKYMLMLKRP